MRVRTKDTGSEKWVGYYNLVRRKAGDVFDLLDDSHFSEKWMEKVSDKAPKTDAPGEPDIKDLMADGIIPEKRSPGRPKARA